MYLGLKKSIRGYVKKNWQGFGEKVFEISQFWVVSNKSFNHLIYNQLMGLFSFIKNAGAKIFGKETKDAPAEEAKELQAGALLNQVNQLGLAYKSLNVSIDGSKVTVSGEVESQEDAEKIILAIGNVEGVDAVEDTLSVVVPKPQAQFHTVVSGDNLSKIAKKFYGSSSKYPVIFEANKPMLSHPDKIYPGQVLRIPPLD